MSYIDIEIWGVRWQDWDCGQVWPSGWLGEREFVGGGYWWWLEEVASHVARRGGCLAGDEAWGMPRRWRGLGSMLEGAGLYWIERWVRP
jgi:hypothetical protein